MMICSTAGGLVGEALSQTHHTQMAARTLPG